MTGERGFQDVSHDAALARATSFASHHRQLAQWPIHARQQGLSDDADALTRWGLVALGGEVSLPTV